MYTILGFKKLVAKKQQALFKQAEAIHLQFLYLHQQLVIPTAIVLPYEIN